MLFDGPTQVDTVVADTFEQALTEFVKAHGSELEIGGTADWRGPGSPLPLLGAMLTEWWSLLDIALTIRAEVPVNRPRQPRQDRETPIVEEYVAPPSPRPSRQGSTDRMIALCRSFPSLDRPDLPTPWDARKFEAWSREAWATSGSGHASRFVLAVWSGKTIDRDERMTTVAAVEDDDGTWPMWNRGDRMIAAPRVRERQEPGLALAVRTAAIRPLWTIGPFDVVCAFGSWDERHREAFMAWCAAPWWP